LGETFPLRLQHNPAHIYFPGEHRSVDYREGIFVGYRYYDTKSMEVMFPFGHGLSYTRFEYSNLSVNKNEFSDNEVLKISLTVKNIGAQAGAEVVQVYVHDKASGAVRPVKELQAFQKIHLNKNESQTIGVELDRRAFTYFHPEMKDWYAESGEFDILVGSSSRDIRLHTTVTLNSSQEYKRVIDKYTPFRDIINHPTGRPFVENILESFGTSIDSDKPEDHEAKAIFLSLPLIKSVNFSHGNFSEEMLERLISDLNG